MICDHINCRRNMVFATGPDAQFDNGTIKGNLVLPISSYTA